MQLKDIMYDFFGLNCVCLYLECFEDWNDEGILFCYLNTLSFVTPLSLIYFLSYPSFGINSNDQEIRAWKVKKKNPKKNEKKEEEKNDNKKKVK